jgi:ribosomal protein S18 acetylase RimI-like enzyme
MSPGRLPKPYRIRIATPHDAAMLAAFASRLFVANYAADNDPEDIAVYLGESFSEEIQRGQIEDPRTTVLIAASGGGFLGYAQLRDHETGAAPAGVVGSSLEIQRFYVDDPWHGTGLAQRLMLEVEATARRRSRESIWLGVWERNARAIAFYRKCGFADVGEQAFVLGSDVQTDRVMTLRVAPPPRGDSA